LGPLFARKVKKNQRERTSKGILTKLRGTHGWKLRERCFFEEHKKVLRVTSYVGVTQLRGRKRRGRSAWWERGVSSHIAIGFESCREKNGGLWKWREGKKQGKSARGYTHYLKKQ